jgi:hypothetical protein
MISAVRTKALLTCAGAALLWLAPHPADAAALKVETKGHRFFADVGESGGDFSASAMLTVLVTLNGVPQSNLGTSIPLNPAGIALPNGWRLLSGFTAPPGPLGIGCIVTPTAFTNHGGGIYAIRVAPYLDDPVCRWGLGDYHYVVEITARRPRTPILLRGSGLGVLTIPDTPSVP